MVDVPGVIQSLSALVMGSAYEMARVTALVTIEVPTARCAGQTSDAQAMEPVTSMGTATVNMAGQGNRWTVVFVYQRLFAVVTGRVTTTWRLTKTNLVFVMTSTLGRTAVTVRSYSFY